MSKTEREIREIKQDIQKIKILLRDAIQAREDQDRRLGYTLDEVAKMLNVSYQTVYRMVKSGRLASVRAAGGQHGKLLIPVKSIHEFLSESP